EATGLALFKAAQDRGISLAGIQGDSTQAPTAQPPKGDQGDQDHQAAVDAITGRWKASA
ncbi:S49 family peptidase, partial [Billgrantia azerbaijanica]